MGNSLPASFRRSPVQKVLERLQTSHGTNTECPLVSGRLIISVNQGEFTSHGNQGIENTRTSDISPGGQHRCSMISLGLPCSLEQDGKCRTQSSMAFLLAEKQTSRAAYCRSRHSICHLSSLLRGQPLTMLWMAGDVGGQGSLWWTRILAVFSVWSGWEGSALVASKCAALLAQRWAQAYPQSSRHCDSFREIRMGGVQMGRWVSRNSWAVLQTEVATASEVSNSSKNSLAITDFLAKRMQLVNYPLTQNYYLLKIMLK